MIVQQDSPHLVIMTPDHGLERQVELSRDYVVVGRDPAFDVWLDDPRVSRIHAALRRQGNAIYVQDLDSSGGTFVGGTAVTASRELRPGEVVSFASVTARFEPAVLPAPRTRTKARWLSWTGLLVLAEGYAIAALTKRSLARQHGPALQGGKSGLAQYRFGPTLAGIPTGLLGWALAGAGFLLLLADIGLHIAASPPRTHAH
jgi:pSer/pThr/pTyr-binding forkhead associated (FHA) protein